MFMGKNTILYLVLEVSTQLPPSLGLVSRTLLLAMASKDAPPVIDLLEEEEEEWPDAGAQNPGEAQKYIDRINSIFDHLSKLIHEDKKDALGTTIRNFKKWIVKQWVMMGDADIDVVLCNHKGPHHSLSLPTPHQGRSRCLWSPRRYSIWARVHSPVTWEDMASGRNGLHNIHLRPCISSSQTSIFSLCQHQCLAKVTDRATLHTVINGAVQPLIQINIPEGLLNPVEDRWPKTMEERKMGEGPQNNLAHGKCTMFGPWAKERPLPVY